MRRDGAAPVWLGRAKGPCGAIARAPRRERPASTWERKSEECARDLVIHEGISVYWVQCIEKLKWEQTQITLDLLKQRERAFHRSCTLYGCGNWYNARSEQRSRPVVTINIPSFLQMQNNLKNILGIATVFPISSPLCVDTRWAKLMAATRRGWYQISNAFKANWLEIKFIKPTWVTTIRDPWAIVLRAS